MRSEARLQLFNFAETMRLALEPGLPRSLEGKVQSDGACLYASLLLCSVINKFGIAEADIRGGGEEFDGGILGADGKRHGHYWVLATMPDKQQFVLDITADQFGHASVYVEPLAVAAGRYNPGLQELIDVAAVELAESFGDPFLVKYAAKRLRATNHSSALPAA